MKWNARKKEQQKRGEKQDRNDQIMNVTMSNQTKIKEKRKPWFYHFGKNYFME